MIAVQAAAPRSVCGLDGAAGESVFYCVMPVSSRSWVICRQLATACLLCGLLLAGGVQAGDEVKAGGWRLASESSPYLQLHADNPVEWYPWGAAAFEKARRENKPVFISIGYFTCHWCHVMARESFSNPEIAALLNESFVAIKVDREQRPDIDAAYMNYVIATRGQGGWPMSVWATPQGHPFLGGTYYPPEASLGRTGFRQLLERLIEAWRTDREGVMATADSAVAMLQKLERTVMPDSGPSGTLPGRALEALAASYDDMQGGFGPAPKFPQPARLLFLLQAADDSAADMALFTLDEMARGGIHDQLGGGFHRYSTDFEWRVPHFEKMLYDQALVARAYLFAWRRTGEARYADLARRTLDFALREMRSAAGGFYSALSADSHVMHDASGHMTEGAFYTWTWQQLTDALGEGRLREHAMQRYGLTKQGNAISDPLGEMAGRNVLYRPRDEADLAESLGTDLLALSIEAAGIDRRLLASRRQRPAVPVDDKIVAAWNGYMLTTLALAGRLLDEPRYLQAAQQTAAFLHESLYDDRTDVLYRDWRGGERGVPGFSTDYAALSEGLLTLYKVTGERRWLQLARRMLDSLLDRFQDGEAGGFYLTTGDTDLWLREKPASDGASLAVNGIAIHVLLDLARITGEPAYRDSARRTATWLSAQLENSPAALPYALIRWQELQGGGHSQGGSSK
jgi:uncharacterized protein YyaL (SSP411 family)